MTTTKTPAAKASAQEAHRAAIEASAAALDAIGPARDGLTAAQDALAAANAEAFEAITVKSADPAAARERIEKARAAIKDAEDNVTWSVLQLHAREVQHEEAHAAEQAARRAITAAEYVAAHRDWNDPNSREEQLLAQLTSIVAELIPLVNDRKDRHDRLASEYRHLPKDERPQLKAGRPIVETSTRWATAHVADVVPEVVEAVRAGAAAAQAELAERERARQARRYG